MGKYFGTDGIRSVVGGILTNEFAYKIGVAIAKVLDSDTLVVGMDTRESSRDFAHYVIKGFKSVKEHVIFAGVCPTPMVAHYAKIKRISGVMITASHNPFNYNGIKVFNKGYKLNLETELKIEEEIEQADVQSLTVKEEDISNDVWLEYENVYKALRLEKYDIKVGLDCAHGAAYKIAPLIFKSFVKDLVIIGNQPQGTNINLDVGSTHPEAMISLVKEKQLDIGFSLDGDADRIFVTDSEGKIYDGDLLVYIISRYLKKHHILYDHTVVLTKMSNPGLLDALNEFDIQYHLTDVGDKYVQQALELYGYSVGGESSGHLMMPNYIHTGDGIFIAVFLLKIIKETQQSLSELTRDVKLYPFKLVNLKNIDPQVLNEPEVISLIEQMKITLGSDSLLYIRPSGTEPLLRVTVSCKDELLLDECVKTLSKRLKKEGMMHE